MTRPKWMHWRRWFWAYRSAAGGWCVYIFTKGFWIKGLD